MNQEIANRLASFRSGADRIRQRLEYEAASVLRLQEKVLGLEEERLDLQKALALIDRAIEMVSAHGIGKMESIVTAGLRQVFDDPKLGFVVEKRETARGASYRLLVRHGETMGNPMVSFGGGVQNVIAFLLRIILVKRFKLAKFLCLDESFNNVYSRYLPRVSTLLQTLCSDYGFTILAITHQPRLAQAASLIYEVVPGDPSPLLLSKDYRTIWEEESMAEECLPASPEAK